MRFLALLTAFWLAASPGWAQSLSALPNAASPASDTVIGIEGSGCATQSTPCQAVQVSTHQINALLTANPNTWASTQTFSGNILGEAAVESTLGYQIGGQYVLRDDLAGNTGAGYLACYVTANATQNACFGRAAGGTMSDLATNAGNAFYSFNAGGNLNMPGSGGLLTITSSGGVMQSCSVSAGGSGYTEPPLLDLADAGGGINGAVSVTVSGGGLSGCSITAGGSSYSNSFNPIILGIQDNVADGVDAMEGSGHGGYSMWRVIAIGPQAAQSAYNEYGSIFIGYESGLGANGGDFDACVGDSSCQALTSGSAISALGRGACDGVTSGAYDVCLGHASGLSVTIGAEDTFAGDISCDVGLTTASNVTCLGAETTDTGNYANSTAAGFGAAITAAHQVVLGTANETVILPGPTQRTTIYSAAGTPVPTCNSAAEGTEVGVSDATAATYRAAYVSGGSNHVKLYCTGSGGWVAD